MKRWVDALVSGIALIILSPFFLIIAIIIKLDSEGGVFVKLKRISQRQGFWLYKFRSMVKDAEQIKSKLTEYNERNGWYLFHQSFYGGNF